MSQPPFKIGQKVRFKKEFWDLAQKRLSGEKFNPNKPLLIKNFEGDIWDPKDKQDAAMLCFADFRLDAFFWRFEAFGSERTAKDLTCPRTFKKRGT